MSVVSCSPQRVRKRRGGGCFREMEGRRFSLVFLVLVLVVGWSECFVVGGEGASVQSEDVGVTPQVLVGNVSVEEGGEGEKGNVNLLGGGDELPSFNVSKPDTWGKGNGTRKSCDENVEDSSNAEKIEQMLWDIFVEDDEETPSEDENNEPKSLDSDENQARDDTQDENESESTFEEILSDSIAAHSEDDHHVISKRSTPNDPEDVLRSGKRSHGQRPHGSKHQQPSRKRYKPERTNKKGHRVTSRRHANPRTKQTSKKSTNVSKYNEYMDVVLKRMNSMIKTKHMDPLMVNLFSGGSGQGPKNQGAKKPVKKKKKGYTGRKKRKGAKNRARMEEIEGEDSDPEGRSVSSSESETVELDGVDGVQGVGGVFIRRVGVIEDSEEMEDDAGEEEEEDEGRGFREIRALIVNGSMKRSTGPNATTEAPSRSVNSTKSAEDTQETRGFGKSPVPPSPTASTSSEESPRKKQTTKSKKKPEKKNQSKPSKPQKKTKATRGVLKGLSSLKRFGDVDVVRQSDSVRIVRGKFLLGPVTLEIVPRGGGKKSQNEDEDVEEGRGKKNGKKGSNHRDAKQPPKVTAVARELKGIIEIRIKKNSPTTIKRLRVFPPSSVKIKPADKLKPTKNGSVPRYSRVTPVATHRLRQIASAVVRQADVKRKSSSLEKRKRP